MEEQMFDEKSAFKTNFGVLGFILRKNTIHVMAYSDVWMGNSAGKHLILWTFLEAVEILSRIVGEEFIVSIEDIYNLKEGLNFNVEEVADAYKTVDGKGVLIKAEPLFKLVHFDDI